METWLGWTIFGVIGALIVAFSAGFILYYKTTDEPGGITLSVGFFALSFTLLSLFLIPADVYMSSSNSYTGNQRDEMKWTYYGMMPSHTFSLPFPNSKDTPPFVPRTFYF